MLTFEIAKTNTPLSPKGSRPYFDSSTPHIHSISQATISSVKQSKTNVTHLSRRNKASSAFDHRPSLSFSSLQCWKADPIFTRAILLALSKHRVYTRCEWSFTTKYYRTHYNQWCCPHWMLRRDTTTAATFYLWHIDTNFKWFSMVALSRPV